MPNPSNEAAAVSLALQMSGLFPQPWAPPQAQTVSTATDQTPFLSSRIRSLGDAWDVRLADVSLNLPSALPGFEDPYRRTFTVRVGGGTVLGIRSRSSIPLPELRPRATAQVAEPQLRDGGEYYLGLPAARPGITFLQAVDRVLGEGIGSPLMAPEIDGLYVEHARQNEAPTRAWVIELRGLPPFPIKGPRGADSNLVPAWQRNHMRNVVDAQTGQVLFANNTPQPEEFSPPPPPISRRFLSPRFEGDPVLIAVQEGRQFLRRGSRGEAVRKVQSALMDLSYPLPRFGADGKFGSETNRAVRAFQADQRRLDPAFKVDGVVGPQTLGALDRTLASRGFA